MWLQILSIDLIKARGEYTYYTDAVEKNLSTDVQESIDVDVKRSFNMMVFMKHENLRNILRAFALTNEKLNYCQGMNFMAGFLFLTMLPEEALKNTEDFDKKLITFYQILSNLIKVD